MPKTKAQLTTLWVFGVILAIVLMLIGLVTEGAFVGLILPIVIFGYLVYTTVSRK